MLNLQFFETIKIILLQRVLGRLCRNCFIRNPYIIRVRQVFPSHAVDYWLFYQDTNVYFCVDYFECLAFLKKM